MDTTHELHVIRDATRGGVGTVLYEIAGQSQVGVQIDAAKIPVATEVQGVCGMLGLEPLYLACEGRLVIFAPKENAEAILQAEVGKVFEQVLCDAGVFKRDEAGKTAFLKFLQIFA